MSDIHQEIAAHIPSLRRYARALVHDVVTADDLVQDCLARALDKLHLWRPGTNLRGWLFTVLHNQYVNEVRRSVRRGRTVELNDATLPSRPANHDKVLEIHDLDRALDQLPAEMRVVILLVGLEGMPYDAVANTLGIPIGTVRSRLSRGRDALRRLMDIEANRPSLPTTHFRRIAPTPQTLGVLAV
jgi:RNA polymerase sigma-70 factor (ECF subfamily)